MMDPWNAAFEGLRLSLKVQDLGPDPSICVAFVPGVNVGVVNSGQSDEVIP